jgi:PKD repeat protein
MRANLPRARQRRGFRLQGERQAIGRVAALSMAMVLVAGVSFGQWTIIYQVTGSSYARFGSYGDPAKIDVCLHPTTIIWNSDNPLHLSVPVDWVTEPCSGSVRAPGTNWIVSYKSSARGHPGVLSATASIKLTGNGALGPPYPNFFSCGGQIGYGDTLRVNSPGGSGTMILTFTITGSSSQTPGQSGRPQFQFMPSLPDLSPDWSHVTNYLVTNNRVDIPVQVTFGQPVGFWVFFYALAQVWTWQPGAAADATFWNTAELTSIAVNDSAGAPVSDFTIEADSGVRYDANGAHADDLATGPPTAYFSALPQQPHVGESVQLTDLSGAAPTSWAWDFGDGATSSERNPTHAFTAVGPYTVALTASNGDGSATATQTLDVVECALSCTAQAARSSGPVPLSAQFTSQVTADNCLAAPTYAWDFGDGGSSADANPQHTYAAVGSFPWTLTVTADGKTCSSSGTVTVLPCSVTCDATATPGFGVRPMDVRFDASATTDNCEGTPSFAWTTGDGATSSEASFFHTYTGLGQFGWTMTVTVDDKTCARSGAVSVAVPGGAPRRTLRGSPTRPSP